MSDDNDPIEVGVLVVLTVPRRMVPQVEHEVSTCISFGKPVVTTIYDVPARSDEASDDKKPRKASDLSRVGWVIG